MTLSVRNVIAGLCVLSLLLAAFQRWLGFDGFISDAQHYWRYSLAPGELHPFHLPGYPLLIAAVRIATFGVIPAPWLMPAVSIASLAAGAWFVSRAVDGGARIGALAAALFGLWPFVGLSYVVYPIADATATCLIAATVWLLVRNRYALAGVVCGAALITHKALLPLGVLLAAGLVLQQRNRRSALFAALAALPLIAVWIVGMGQFGSASWLVAANLKMEVASQHGWPLLDGLIGSLEDGWRGWIKASMITLSAGLSIVLAVRAFRDEGVRRAAGIAICATILVYCVALNRHEIWASVRFSRLLAIPVGWYLLKHARALDRRWTLIAAGVVLAATQFVYGWHIVNVLSE